MADEDWGLVMPGRMSWWNQRWLEGLGKVAVKGLREGRAGSGEVAEGDCEKGSKWLPVATTFGRLGV